MRKVECKTAASRSKLPGLDWAINPYRGCSHSCAYCYAQDVTRFETGRDWGTVVEVKINIVSRLERELVKGARGVYGMGTVTDPYQEAEKEYELTRGCLQVLKRANANVSILTKSDLVLRDLDLLRGWNGCEVGVSIGCSDDAVASIIEPGACSPARRYKVLAELLSSGVESYVMAAPVVHGLCDSEASLTDLVSRSAEAGVRRMIWDGFNAKPIALRRLREALLRKGITMKSSGEEPSMKRTEALLANLCRERGIDLSSAF